MNKSMKIIFSLCWFLLHSSFANAGTFVHLFEWQWSAVASECKHVLGPAGYQAVQVSPPQKSIGGSQWWTRYQPISYEIEGRSGSRHEFAKMVKQCRKAGVEVYVDAVINHMAAWDRYFPEVPYDNKDFHDCAGPIDYSSVWSIQHCDLVGLNDLRTESEYVRDKLAEYLNDLLSMGVSGFRIDAAKHIPPQDIQAILKALKQDGARPFVFQEVIGDRLISASEYAHLGRVTEFNFTNTIGHFFKGRGPLNELKNIGAWEGWLASEDAVTFVANHDNQRQNTSNIITHKDGNDRNKLAHVFTLAWPYGYPKVMSSFDWDDHDAGPPSQCATSCFDGWLCEHRQREIANMVQFRNVTENTPVKNWWDNGGSQLAFSRGDLGFVAINGDQGGVMMAQLQTGLAAGTYCDVLSGDNIRNKKCTGRQFSVDEKGMTNVILQAQKAIALHAKAMIAEGPDTGDSCKRPSMHVSGSFNDWSTPKAMVCNAGTWQARVAFKPSSEPFHQFVFDIRGNGRNLWGDNNLDSFTDKRGDKIPLVASGEYFIQLDDKTGEYRASLIKPLSEEEVSVEVFCRNGETYFGQSVYVVGDSDALGNWDPKQAVKLEPIYYPKWHAKVSVPKNQFIEWKCIKREEQNPFAGLDWQEGSNNVFYADEDKMVFAGF